MEPATALKGRDAGLRVVKRAGPDPLQTVTRLCPCPGKRGAVPEQVLDTEVAPQLTAQDGDDGGDLGGGEARLIEEEEESGDELCLVGNLGISGSVPGEPGGRR